MPDEPISAYVLWYNYSDNSSSGVLRVYLDEERAKEDLDLLMNVEDGKQYTLDTVPLYGDAPV